jgi:hypothetical protein
MVQKYQAEVQKTVFFDGYIQVIRHAQVCKKLQVSSAKLFDMCAKGQFIKPFLIIPGGRAVGWIERDVDGWILQRKEASEQETT